MVALVRPTSGIGARRVLVRAVLGAIGAGVVSSMIEFRPAPAHHRHKRRRRRCRQRCQGNRQTCDLGCDILDGDSQIVCHQGCHIAQSQCRTNC